MAKLSFSPYLPNSPLSPTFMGPLHCFVLCLVGDCGKIVIFAIFPKFAAFANFYGPPSLLCALPRWRLWQNCHFRHICQIRRFRQFLWGPFTALCFASLAIVAKLSFSPYLPNSPLSPTFMGPLHCFVLCLVGDCGKIVIFAIFAKFAAFANVYGPPSLLCALPRWQLWQNCHFRHICQIRRFRQLLWAPFTAFCFASLAIEAKLSFSPYLPNSPLSPTFMGPLHCFVFCLVGDCGKIVIFAIFANSPLSPTFMGPLHFFVLCLVGDCGKIVIFAIFAKFAAFANVYGPPSLLCALPRWQLWQNCHFRHICQIRRFRQLLWAPFTAFCFASLAIEAKLSFSPYLPNSPLSPTFMGPLHCFVLCLVGDCGKIVIFAIFAKFAAFANFYGAPSLLCALPCWRLWQNCHFRHICQIRRFRQLLWGPYTALCYASLAIVAKLSFSPYLLNSPFSPTFMGPVYCFVLCLVGDCGKIVIFAIFAKFAAFANFYGPPSLLCALPRWRLWQNCHFRHNCKFAAFANVYGPPSLLCALPRWRLWQNCHFRHISQFAAFANFYGPPSLLCALPRWRLWQNCHFRHICKFAAFANCYGPLHCFVLCLVGDCGKIVIFAISAKFVAFANFYGPPSLLCVLPRWRLWQNCHFRHNCKFAAFANVYGPPSLLCALPRWQLWQNCHFRHIAKFAAFANCYGPPSLLCALPRWRLRQNCHFRHICQNFASIANEAKHKAVKGAHNSWRKRRIWQIWRK